MAILLIVQCNLSIVVIRPTERGACVIARLSNLDHIS